jgi:deoxyribodipyrimidine photolyase
VSAKAIHKWDECWTLFRQSGYPKPIVDYKKQKEKALDMYKAI